MPAQCRALPFGHRVATSRSNKGACVRELPSQQLNPKIKNVWRINDAI